MTDNTTGQIVKRSISIAGHSTSVSLEDVFWAELKVIAKSRGQSLVSLVTEIDAENQGNLSSALRCFVLGDIKDKAQK